MNSRPNILFIITDQQHWRALSAMGNAALRTPHMDRLVRRGTVIERSYCASPVCGPSRMSLATGLPPHEHGYTHHFPQQWDWAARGLISFGHSLRAGGYETYWSGKWHASVCFPTRENDAPGFTNLSLGHDDTGLMKEIGWEIDEAWAGRAADFLRKRDTQSAPFFLGVSLLNPHDICYWIMNLHADRLKAALARLPQAPVPLLPANMAIDPGEPEIMRHRRTVKKYGPELQWTLDWTDADWTRYLYTYYRLVERVDAEIGRVLDALDASGHADNTLIVFTSDHGEGCASHRLVVKLSAYEEALRVPLAFSWPGRIAEGCTVTTQVANGLDLGATMLDFAGVPPLAPSRGISLRHVVLGSTPCVREFAVSELYPDRDAIGWTARIVTSVTGKYLLATDGNGLVEEAFYDLAGDPGEMANAIRNPAMAARIQPMREYLAGWMAQTGDPLASLLPGRPADSAVA
ncbi:hypothetical protein DB346_00875 [Verrucomicrobia bacterium LW23]|nr:hypothetical protein DB346_00875 [Verrucomicrobia bacterium LW23]